ncbi:glutathione S-transferase [Glaciimonas sp. PAMC28666]|uniref:glutathione S-transferase n=1 Tax=Glaciimonas sp. PAMC28666 TaxID=2807626 RepID=UPI00196657CF|nr:glutathione S-transferase [Glaciimonas sp. PAMC28666]QRX83514.1 glutathione S-transferase [Glaciimonas sp. PAMC28666]
MIDFLIDSVHPVLYTFRRCPYAIRARLAIKASGTPLKMVEVSLRNKPQAMLDCSPKGTVPVLQLQDGTVIDQSLDIMRWALAMNDPLQWLDQDSELAAETAALIAHNDGSFKVSLDRYKYAERFPEFTAADYRAQCELFLSTLNERLALHSYLVHDQPSLADMAIFPFVRQYAHVDKVWFYGPENPHPHLIRWLDGLTASPLFIAVMEKT